MCRRAREIIDRIRRKSQKVDHVNTDRFLRAIRDRDAEMAEQLANEHIIHVMQNLKKQGY